MATPYATPRYPGAPHSTPSSQNLARTVPRPPIHNPYDKFTQPEFDSWIGGLTGALKRALGREDYHEESSQSRDQVDREDDAVEDSFAEVKARRAAKGKERATDLGGEDQPIEILSDSEEEESVAEEDEIWDDQYVSEEDASEESGDSGSEEHHDAEAEVVELLSDEDEVGEAREDIAVVVEDEEEGSDAGSDDMRHNGTNALEAVGATAEDVADDEDVSGGSEAGSDEAYDDMLSKLEYEAGVHRGAAEVVDLDETEDAEGENDEESINEEAEAFPSTDEANRPIDLPDPWAGPSTYAEDFYSGGDIFPESNSSVNTHVLPTEQDDDDDDDVIEVANPAKETSQPPELPDPWNGPRIYAEDFYASGDVQESDLRTRLPSPSHLTPRDDEAGIFLTPEGLTPASSRTPETQHTDIFDVGVAEDEKEDDMVLPNQEAHSSSRPERPSDEGGVEMGSSAIQEYALQDFDDDPLEELYGDLGNVQSGQHELGEASSVFGAAVFSNQNIVQNRPSQSPEVWREDSASPPRPGFNVHVDWNYPPAFPTGRLVSRTGHLESSDMHYDNGDEIVEISDDEDDFKHSAQNATAYDVPAGPGLEEAQGDGDEGLPQALSADNGRQVDVPVIPPALELTAGAEPEGDATQELALDDIYSDLDLSMPAGNALNTAESNWPQPTSELSSTQDMLFSQFFTARSESVESSFERAIVGGGETLLERPALPETRQPADTPGLDGSKDQSVAEVTKGQPNPVSSEDAGDPEQQSTHFTEEVSHDDARAETRLESLKEDAQLNDNVTSGISLSSDSQDDTVSVSGEAIAEMKNYIVEEPSTEGGRTEEPTSRHPTPEIEDVILEEEGDLLNAVASPVADAGTGYVLPDAIIESSGEIDIADNIDITKSSAEPSAEQIQQATTLSPTFPSTPERTVERDVTLVSPKPTANSSADSSVPDSTAGDAVTGQLSSQQATAQSAGEALPGNGEGEQPSPDVVQESSVHESVTSDRMLEDGIPMPVSADPAVPDPTGLSHTPIAPLSPRAIHPSFSAMLENAGAHERAESPIDDVFSQASSDAPSRGRSGLFTPLTADNSRQITPEPSSVGLVEDLAGDSPLKITVNADDLEAGGITDHESISPSGEDVATVATQVDEASADDVEGVDAPSSPIHAQEGIDTTSISEAVIPELHHDVAEPEELELTYPSDYELTGDVIDVPAGDVPAFSNAKDTTVDIDAEGDVDPDYFSGSTSVEAVAAPLSRSEDDRTVDHLAASGSAFTPATVRTGDLSLQANHTVDESHSEPTNDHRTLEEFIGPRKDQPLENNLAGAESTVPEAVERNQEAYEEMEEPRPLKRKRTPQVLPPRLTRSTSAKEAIKSKPQPLTKLLPILPENNKGKGKKKQEDNTESDDEDAESQAASHTSESVSVGSTSDASMLIFSRSRPSSRASSIGSAAPSNGSLVAPISPTLMRAASQHHNVPSAPFVHAHGPLHHHHGRPALQPQISTERRRAASPSISVPNSVPEISEPGPSQPLPAPSRKPLPSSPVTRSNCRFHKISLPHEENGLRVFFVVPGCSLGNRELMDEEHIEDHGPAILDADTRLVGDIEGVDFSPYLLGILRQLVGVDLLREQEVFYLPQTGEEYRRKSKRKSRIAKTTLSGKARDSISARTLPGAESAGPYARNPGVREPRSRAGSASTTGSRRRGGPLSERGSLTTTASVSGSDLSDLSEAEGRDVKRSKLEPEAEQTVQVETEKAESVPKAALVASRRLGTRRSKRLSVDARAYKPDDEAEPPSDEDTIPSGRRRKRKGLKRSRAGEPEDGSSRGAAVKKRRLREKTSADRSATDHEMVYRHH